MYNVIQLMEKGFTPHPQCPYVASTHNKQSIAELKLFERWKILLTILSLKLILSVTELADVYKKINNFYKIKHVRIKTRMA